MSRRPLVYYPGQVIGKLTVLGPAPGRKGQRRWRCRCSCPDQREIEINAGKLRCTKSCGCYRTDWGMAHIKHHVKVGDVFSRLTVLSSVPGKGPLWLCECRCGERVVVKASSLVSGKTTSCGCRQRQAASEVNKTHGGSKDPEHHVWAGIKQACENQHRKEYPKYGGRGIYVCEDHCGWHDYAKFLSDMGRRPSKFHVLARKDRAGPYCKDNCFWSSRKDLQNTQDCCHVIEFHGERMTVSQWASKLGVHKALLVSRLRRGWPVEDALTRPSNRGTFLRPRNNFGRGRVIGVYPSIKSATTKECPYRSSLELRFMRLLDADHQIASWSYEPSVVEFDLDGTRHWTIPDFVVTLDNGNRFVCEVKSTYYLPKHLESGKYDAVRSWAHSQQMPYVLWTEDGFLWHEQIEAMKNGGAQ